MKGTDTFTIQEIEQIKILIRQRGKANRDQQKTIRSKMRAIGFYGRDDWNIVDCQASDLEKLINSGRIKVIDGKNISNTKDTHLYKTKFSQKAKTASTAISVKRKNESIKTPYNTVNRKMGLKPWIGENPKILILGTLPGEQSLKQQAYYCNSRNSFWKIMRNLFPHNTKTDNKTFITSCGIALWDCIQSGEREGSLDSGFNVNSLIPNDIHGFLLKYPTIRTIVFNGGKAAKFFKQYCKNTTCDTITLVSTSSAAAIPFHVKLERWAIIKDKVLH